MRALWVPPDAISMNPYIKVSDLDIWKLQSEGDCVIFTASISNKNLVGPSVTFAEAFDMLPLVQRSNDYNYFALCHNGNPTFS